MKSQRTTNHCPTMIPDRLKEEITAWLEFYQDLGIDEFLLQSREGQRFDLLPARATEEPPEAQPEALTQTVGTSVFPITTAATVTRIEDTPAAAPVRPPTAARSLNLFESESPRRPEQETLEEIRTDLGDCQRCKLAAGRKHIVFGQGDPHAELVFVGEGPGADEDEQGLPFVGRAGQLLNRMLQFVSIRREDVYICNVVKCRPPGNRTPERDEVDACSPFLFRQIEAIRPRLVCCLGAPAVKTVLGLKDGILKLRGRFYDFGGAKALATVHPAYILRNPREERILREDFEKIRDFLRVK
ncbi:MAG TPA: uracil-DNA glycosylase [Terriglobia bacterium]|nr:uracil-DNA glycosylase [Terriglobia bacterium]